MATIHPKEPVLQIYREPLMNATCPSGHRNDIPSGLDKNLRETDDGHEADFSCPDGAPVFRHWVHIQMPPMEADPDTLMH